MTLTIELTPEEETRLQEEAQRAGVAPADYAHRLITEDLAVNPENPSGALIEEIEGVAYVAGTGVKVRIASEALGAGYSLPDLQEAYPHLTLMQLHAALAYYYSHKATFDSEIARLQRKSEERARTHKQPTRAALEERARQRGYVVTPEGLKKSA